MSASRRAAGCAAGVFAGVLCVGLFGNPSFAGGTGGGMQVPNLPTGRFTQPGPPGTCQCITNDRGVDMKCVTSAAACESICASRSYSFVPDALLSCRGGTASPVAAAPSIPPAGNRPMSPR